MTERHILGDVQLGGTSTGDVVPARISWFGAVILMALGIGVLTAGGLDEFASLALPVVFATAGSRRNMLELLLWIGGGACVLGAIGWASGAVAGVAPVVGLATGITIGGGLGGVVRLMVVEDTTDTSETVTIDDTDKSPSPSPEPADLFEANPDPILYYDDSGDGPVVLAVNPAFEEKFGVPETGVMNAGLADALMTPDPSAVVEAAKTGEPLDIIRTCETADGETEKRIRIVSVDSERGSHGYILYSDVTNSD